MHPCSHCSAAPPFCRRGICGCAVTVAFDILRGRGESMGLVKTRRPARHSLRSACSRPYGLRTPARGGYAMHPPSPRLRRTGRQQRAKAGMKPLMKGNARKGLPRQPAPAPKMIKQVRPVLSFWKSRGGFGACSLDGLDTPRTNPQQNLISANNGKICEKSVNIALRR